MGLSKIEFKRVAFPEIFQSLEEHPYPTPALPQDLTPRRFTQRLLKKWNCYKDPVLKNERQGKNACIK